MKHVLIILSILVGSLTANISQAQNNKTSKSEFPILKGPYLGQKPPGLTPEVFAPGIISKDEFYEINSVFTPDGKEFYYVISASSDVEKKKGIYFYYLMYTKRINGIWHKPEKLPIAGSGRVVDIAIAPDGNRLYFCSEQYDEIDYSGPLDIYYVDLIDSGWSMPVKLPPIINTVGSETQPSFSGDGKRMYFSSGTDKVGIYYSDIVDGVFSDPVYLNDSINGGYGSKGNSFMAPDESYIIFARWGIPDSINIPRGMYICFKKKSGSWTKPIHARPKTGMHGSLAALSPDGKYLFYSGNKNIYWVDVRILDKLKPNGL